MAHFEIKNLTFAYPSSKSGKLSLDHINLTIERGDYIVLCGKSGSGKTTLLKHLKSVLRPSGPCSGEILFEGKPINDIPERVQAAKIGYVMQNPDNQIVTDKVWHELAFGLENLGVDQKTIRIRVAEMASYFGIQSWFNKDVAELSGGQKQLLNLASIMAMQPTVLILDEPTSQLDPIAAADFFNTVKKINLELGTTVIITEHRLEEIFHAADKVVVMEAGKIIACDTPKKVGEQLKKENNDMFSAMPTPVQVFYGVDSASENHDISECPLTVREGRNWLSDTFSSKAISETKVDIEKKQIINKKDLSAIAAKDVWFRYEKNAPDVLKGASIIIPSGSIYAILGGNGTGKSTFLKSIAGILKPYKGQILINNIAIHKYKDKDLFRKNFAMLPQDPLSLFAKKTVREELAEMLPDPRNEEVIEHNEKVIKQVSIICEIANLLDTHPYDLSGGEQQRAALAKVLLTEPKILLLDEPTKGIDNFFKIKFADILKRLSKAGITVLMVSHDVEFCAKYADYVGMFFEGQMITANVPNEFFSQNSFYTTAANRMSRHIFENAITTDDVINLCRKNLGL